MCRIVLAQLEGSGRGGLGSYNAKAHEDLLSLLDEVPVKDGNAWIETLMHRNEMLGKLSHQCLASLHFIASCKWKAQLQLLMSQPAVELCLLLYDQEHWL